MANPPVPPVPVRPVPYVAPGDGWLFKVKVPAHGVWRRRQTQVSQTWTVYENAGADFHVTISSAFLTDQGANLDTHVTSNVPIGLSTVHWPVLPGTNLTPAQQQWLAAHNTAGFTALIAAFSQQLLACAANIAPSRAYDAAVAQRRQAIHTAAAQQRASNATYQTDLEDWLKLCQPGPYQEAFRDGQTYYFLDPNQGVVLKLDPPPLLIKQGSGLNPGFVNRCKMLTIATPLQQADWTILDDGLVLLKVAGAEWAMLKTDFDKCQPAKDLLSLDELVDQAVDAWTQNAAVTKRYDMIASNQDQMNVSGPDGARCHLQIADVMDGAQLKSHGTTEALVLAPPMQPTDLPAGMYRQQLTVVLQNKLPKVVRIRRGTTVSYISPGKLQGEWLALQNANVIGADQLAEKLDKYQFCAENLKVKDDAGLIVYLWPLGGGRPLFVGLKNHVAPGATVNKNCVLTLDNTGVRELCTALKFTVLTTGQAATIQDAVVICDSSGQLFKPPIFVSNIALEEFDYAQAQAAYIPIQQAAEQQKAQDAQAAAASYPAAWTLLVGLVAAKSAATIDLYSNRADGPVIVVVASGNPPSTPGLIHIGSVTVTKEDKSLPSKKKYRLLEFSGTNDLSKGWCAGLIEHVKNVIKPGPPSGIKQYVFSPKQ